MIDYDQQVLQWYGHDYIIHDYPEFAPHIGDLHVSDTTGYQEIDEALLQYKELFSTKEDPLGYCDSVPMNKSIQVIAPLSEKTNC